jgi:hypothetical protein
VTAPTPERPLTIAQAFFREGFGCVGQVVVQIALIFVVVIVVDWRYDRKAAREAAERTRASETAGRLVDEFAKDVDSEGRFVRKQPEGPLPDADAWGRQFRLAYQPGTFSDGLEVRSAGPDGEWSTWDDVVVARSSRISNTALARDAASGVLDAAKAKLWGTKPRDGEKIEKK